MALVAIGYHAVTNHSAAGGSGSVAIAAEVQANSLSPPIGGSFGEHMVITDNWNNNGVIYDDASNEGGLGDNGRGVNNGAGNNGVANFGGYIDNGVGNGAAANGAVEIGVANNAMVVTTWQQMVRD